MSEQAARAVPPRKRTIAFILTSVDRIESTGGASGSWLEELATPYYVALDSGYEVNVVSVRGGAAPLDPLSLSGDFCTDAGRRFQADATAMSAVSHTTPLADLRAESIDAVFFVGGTGVMWDFPNNSRISQLLGALSEQRKPIGAVCHGVSSLLNGPAGKPIVHDRRITVISDEEDRLFGVAGIVPFLPESRFRQLGVHVSVGAPFAAHVIEDGLFVTGQNPASAGETMRRILALLAQPGP
jgi:putative intracellular protease/amidase